MNGAFLVLALATTARVAIPAIESDPSLHEIGIRLHEHLSRQVESSGCVPLFTANGNDGGEKGGEDGGDVDFQARLATCNGRLACMGEVARGSDVGHLLLATLTRTDDVYQLESLVFDVANEAEPVLLPGMKTGSLVKLTGHLKTLTDALCAHVTGAAVGGPETTGVASLPTEPLPSDAAEAVHEESAMGDLFELPPELLDVLDAPAESLAEVEPGESPQADDGAGEPVVAAEPVNGTSLALDADAEVDSGAEGVDGTPAVMVPAPPKGAPPSLLPPFVQQRPYAFVALGAGVATALTGVVLGMGSQGIWAENSTHLRDGVVHNSITREDARRANALAVGANVLFGAAGVLAAGGTALLFVPTTTGASIGGSF